MKRDAADLLIAGASFARQWRGGKEEPAKSHQRQPAKVTEEQATSAVGLLDEVCAMELFGGELDRECVQRIRTVLDGHLQPKGKWHLAGNPTRPLRPTLGNID